MCSMYWSANDSRMVLLMNTIVTAIFLASFILLIRALLMRIVRSSDSEDLQEELQQRSTDKNRRRAAEAPLPSADGNSWLIQQPKPHPKSKENVTGSLTNEANPNHCPACGAIITSYDERCPSCEIAFVADGSRKWTLGTVGPADGIYRPPTEVSE